MNTNGLILVSRRHVSDTLIRGFIELPVGHQVTDPFVLFDHRLMELLLLATLDGHVAADTSLLDVVDDAVDDALMTCSIHFVFLVGLKKCYSEVEINLVTIHGSW